MSHSSGEWIDFLLSLRGIYDPHILNVFFEPDDVEEDADAGDDHHEDALHHELIGFDAWHNFELLKFFHNTGLWNVKM